MQWLFLRMARWVRHPPPRRMIYVAAIAVAVSVAIYLIEHYVGWPAWLTLDPARHRILPHIG